VKATPCLIYRLRVDRGVSPPMAVPNSTCHIDCVTINLNGRYPSGEMSEYDDATRNDSDSIISEDSDDLLRDLLGGIAFDVEWKEEIVDSSSHPKVVDDKIDRTVTVHDGNLQSPTASDEDTRGRTDSSSHGNPSVPSNYYDTSSSSIYENSYRCSMDGKIERPPVQVVNMTHLGRGNALVMTVPISRGSVIYTEKAIVATQVPPIEIRACTYCFQSLEGIDTLSASLPYPQLWPIPSLDFSNQWTTQSETDSSHTSIDRFGRIQSTSCQSLFCCAHHLQALHQKLGDSCLVKHALNATTTMMDDLDSSVPASIALTSRVFCHCVQYYRTHGQSLQGHFLEGFCGEEDDVNALELGVYDIHNRCYTLEKLYSQLVDILSLSTTEQQTLSLTFLHKVAAQVARNGFGLLTQSPFKTYYASLLRKTGSRDSEEHQTIMKQIAQSLGRDRLERGMDRDIESRVAPEICAIFPLTARCNHSCEPNAQVRSQEFIDARIDIVALRDLQPGEELLISYISVGAGVGKRSTAQRRRELQAKYLFHCDCVRCTSGG